MLTTTVSYQSMEGNGSDRAAAGPDSLNHFLQGVEQRAYKMAYIATYNREDALDIVQDAMLRLVKYYAHKPTEQWAPLFHRILQRRIMDWYRRRKLESVFSGWFVRARDEDEAEIPLEIADESGEPSRQTLNDQALAQLDEVLHALPLRQQQAFLLRMWEGFDVQETARAMGCSAGSVKTHYSRAIHTLREKLEGHWP